MAGQTPKARTVPGEGYIGRQRGNVSMTNLQLLNALLYVAEHGCKWRGLPRHLGNWHTVYTRMNRWSKAGVLDRVFERLQQEQILAIRIEHVCLDSTTIKVHPDGTGLRRLTDGGKETNNLGGWTRKGGRITMGSNRANPSAIDAYLIDPTNGERELVSGNNGLQRLEDVTRDGTLALIDRLRGRGDNDLYLVDLASHAEAVVTPHDPPGSFAGE